jgi:ferritin-like protein
MSKTPELPKVWTDALDECFAAVAADRTKVLAFFDVRHVFASYCEVTGSIAAACIKNGIYDRTQTAHLLADMLADALTRDSNSKCERRFGDEIVEGSKQ